jgi:Zn-dependent M32 family carboxypeptidase
MIAEELNVDNETVRQILTENLMKKKVCAKMVPKNLSEDQKLNREDRCQKFWKKLKKTQTFSTVSSPAMKLGSFNTTQKPNNNQCSGKQLTLQDQKRHECQNPRSREC